MPLLQRQARSSSPTFLDSPEGRALWHQMEADGLQDAIQAAGFSFPLLSIESAATGFVAVGICREAGHCEPKTETAACTGVFFPVRLTLCELSTLRTHQHVFTEDAWRKACAAWKKERHASATSTGV